MDEIEERLNYLIDFAKKENITINFLEGEGDSIGDSRNVVYLYSIDSPEHWIKALEYVFKRKKLSPYMKLHKELLKRFTYGTSNKL